MENPNFEQETYENHPMGFIAGLLLGGLIGSAVMLLVAPQSGTETRAKIQAKSIELRDQTVDTVQGAVTQARGRVNQITTDVRDKVEELKQRGQDVFTEKKEHLAASVESGNAAVQDFLD